MNATDVIIIGAGQAGLAMSAVLTREGVEHVVLEQRPCCRLAGTTAFRARYRGRDVIWLMDRAGVLDQAVADVGDIDRAPPALAPACGR